MTEDYISGPAPMIQAICRDIGLTQTINHMLQWDETRCKLTPGQRVEAMIINCLMNRSALYQLPVFFEHMDVENMFGQGITPNDLNDHAMGRALDKMAAVGPEKVYGTVSLRVICEEDIDVGILHGDTTSVSVQGAYEEEEPVLNLTHGYSKDRRPDLKQFLYGVGTTADAVPVIGQVRDGNKSDGPWNYELISKLRKLLAVKETPPVYVADSSLVCRDNLKAMAIEEISFISRFPGNFSLEKALKDRAWLEDHWHPVGNFSERKDAARYRIQSFEEELYGVQYRFIVAHSSKLDGRKARSIDRQLQEREDELDKQLQKLSDRTFACEPDAHEAWRHFEGKHKDRCFCLQYRIEELHRPKKRSKPGRPPKGYVPKMEQVYTIRAEFSRDQEAIDTWKSQASCFVLITNLFDQNEWSDRRILKEYKNQSKVEQHFRFMKDPKVTGPIYLKNPERVNALAYIFLLALLVYSIIQRRARRALQHETEPMYLAGRKWSHRPTGRRVLERFHQMRVIKLPDGTRVFPGNLKIPERVLRFLNVDADVYLNGPQPEQF